MPDLEQLLREWEQGDTTGLRPKRIQAVRGDLMDYTDMAIPHRVGQIESWLPRMKAQLTRKLREAADEQGISLDDGEANEADEAVSDTPDAGGDGAPHETAETSSNGGESDE